MAQVTVLFRRPAAGAVPAGAAGPQVEIGWSTETIPPSRTFLPEQLYRDATDAEMKEAPRYQLYPKDDGAWASERDAIKQAIADAQKATLHTFEA